MELNNIKSSNINWGDAANDLNQNFGKINNAIEQVKNATTRNKGYFSSDTALKAAFEKASVGDIAYVGNAYPYQIWKWNGSAWANSGSTGGEESVRLGDYHTAEYVDEKLSELESETIGIKRETSRTSVGWNVVQMPFVTGKTYKITNTKDLGTIALLGSNNSDDRVQVIATYIPIGQGKEFVAEVDANYIGIYFGEAGKATISLEEDSLSKRVDTLDTRIEANEQDIDSFQTIKKKSYAEVLSLNGKYIDSKGAEASLSSFRASPFLYLIPNVGITIKGFDSQGANGYSFYDENRNYISGVTGVTSVTIAASDIPTNAKYVRFSTALVDAKVVTLDYSTIDGISLALADIAAMIPKENGIIVKTKSSKLTATSGTSLTIGFSMTYKKDNIYYARVVGGKNISTIQFQQSAANSYAAIKSFTDSATWVANENVTQAFATIYLSSAVSEDVHFEIQIVEISHHSISNVGKDFDGFVPSKKVLNSLPFGEVAYRAEGFFDYMIKGYGEEASIIRDSSGVYTTPPIEVSGGFIKDICIVEDGGVTEHSAYCLHTDEITNRNNKLVIENCRFISNSQACIGVGTREGYELIFKNCTFIQESSAASVYIHNGLHTSTPSATNPSKVTFDNCKFIGGGIKLEDYNDKTDNVVFTFIGNTFIPNGGRKAVSISYQGYADNNEDVFANKFSISEASHGNNIDLLNA